jgi:hypothetical protein
MEEHKIQIPDLRDPSAVRDALVQLKAAMREEYRFKVLTPQIETSLDTAFAEAYYQEMALINGRRPRKPRRPRKNPLSGDETRAAAAYAEAKTQKKRDELRQDLPRVFEKLQKPEDWGITSSRLGELFPQEYKGKDTWRPERRLEALREFDLVSRVGAFDPISEIAQKGRAAVFEKPMPFDHADVRALMTSEAGLSLDEAVQILQAQDQARRYAQTHRGKLQFAMQPSSALNKMYRKRRLSAYRPPAQMFAFGDPRTSKVLILMSPVGLSPRVMTFRHGVHIDADFIGAEPGDIPRLLGQAIKTTLMWLVEKPGRLKKTDVYIGRVGQPDLRLAFKAPVGLVDKDTPVSIASVTANLKKPGHDIYTTGRERKFEVEQDVVRYEEALRQQVSTLVQYTTRSQEALRQQIGTAEAHKATGGAPGGAEPETVPSRGAPRVGRAIPSVRPPSPFEESPFEFEEGGEEEIG